MFLILSLSCRMSSVLTNFYNLSAHQRPMTGDTKMSALGVDHMGWLLCDGRAVLITQFPFLFNVIGYSFGSNTSADFKLPNPAGRVAGAIGTGNYSGTVTTRSLGDGTGTETHTLTIDEMPTHNHTITDPGHAHSYNSVSAALSVVSGGPTDDTVLGANTTGTATTGITINNTGGSNAHNNMQPTLFMGNWFIYSGKESYGNNPFTTGIYAGTGNVPSGSNLV